MKVLVCLSLMCILSCSTAFAQETVLPATKTIETSENEIEKIQKEIKSSLSTLWTVVTLNMITADVLSLYIPESMDEWTDYADGKEEEFMLGAALMYQVPISMIYLSSVLPYKANRWANIISAGLMTTAVIAGRETEKPYYVFAAAEIVCMSYIARKAWKWRNPEEKGILNNIGLNLNYNEKAYGLSLTYRF